MNNDYSEQRVAPRVPFTGKIDIRRCRDQEGTISATSVDISSGGIQFTVPWGNEPFQPGDLIEISLKNLPTVGAIPVQAEIKYARSGIDTLNHRLIFYGAKFTSLSFDTWRYFLDYYETLKTESATTPEAVSPITNPVKQEMRVETLFEAEVSFAGATQAVTVEDLSYGGARVKSPVSIPFNQSLEITFADHDAQFRIRGVCIWSAPEPPGCIAGIFFGELTPDQFNRLREFILDLAKL